MVIVQALKARAVRHLQDWTDQQIDALYDAVHQVWLCDLCRLGVSNVEDIVVLSQKILFLTQCNQMMSTTAQLMQIAKIIVLIKHGHGSTLVELAQIRKEHQQALTHSS